MSNIKRQIQDILPLIQKPSRYIGGEWNSHNNDTATVNIALAYPDVYEVGMSNLGLQIIYEIINDNLEYSAERVFAPWPDMEKEMRGRELPLFTLETTRPVVNFDLFGFTLQYELTYTNILNMLDLAGIPLYRRDRDSSYPLVVGGGPGVYNPEPLADFFDFFVIGEAEEIIIQILDIIRDWKITAAPDKQQLLRSLANLSGIYVPSFYALANTYPLKPLNGAPYPVKKRLVNDFNSTPSVAKPVVPYIESIHDRSMVEIMRGCTRGCRFCQAGIVYRPVRERSASSISKNAKRLLLNTGYNEISLASLSSTDYSQIAAVIKNLTNNFHSQKIAVSLPSLRTDQFSVEIASEIKKIKKTGLTFAPEAGTERLRQVINKGITERDIIRTAGLAFSLGWRRLKLYFMIGLPTETSDDIDGIINLAMQVLDEARQTLPKPDFKGINLNISVSNFIPKAHTPFQWQSMNSLEQIEKKQQLLRSKLRHKQIKLKWHQAEMSIIEGAITRGGRGLAKIIYDAWRLGCKFDGWDEHFSWSKWQEAFGQNNSDIMRDISSGFSDNAALPWEHIDCGVDREWLLEERAKALKEKPTKDCRNNECSLCGVCVNLGAEMEIFKLS